MSSGQNRGHQDHGQGISMDPAQSWLKYFCPNVSEAGGVA